MDRSQGNFLDRPARSGHDYWRNGYGYFHSQKPAFEGFHGGNIANDRRHRVPLDAYRTVREPIQSRRPFSLQVREIVPRTAPLYVYADGMHHFNFYTERDIIPVLCSPGEVADVLRKADDSYLLIKDRDLKTSSMSGPGKIVATDLVGSTIWHLIALSTLKT